MGSKMAGLDKTAARQSAIMHKIARVEAITRAWLRWLGAMPLILSASLAGFLAAKPRSTAKINQTAAGENATKPPSKSGSRIKAQLP
jgi:hypothetical protein